MSHLPVHPTEKEKKMEDESHSTSPYDSWLQDIIQRHWQSNKKAKDPKGLTNKQLITEARELGLVMDQIAMANSPSLSWEWGGGWTTFHFTY